MVAYWSKMLFQIQVEIALVPKFESSLRHVYGTVAVIYSIESTQPTLTHLADTRHGPQQGSNKGATTSPS